MASPNLEGISIWSDNNVIGGTSPAWRNLLSGNLQDGIFVNEEAQGNVVQGNLIGTDITGTVSLANAYFGIALWGATGNTLGGTDHGSHNVVSGNGVTDIMILYPTATGNTVQGNFIGTDVTGTSRVENSFTGVLIQQGASNNSIGGSESSARNIISGKGNGVYMANVGTMGNSVQGNYIGTDCFGTEELMNSDVGVRIEEGASDNMIGGTGEGEDNIIAFNLHGGVHVSSGTENAILSNSIYSNGGLGINLGTDTVTPNDTLDGDSGANDLQNFPVLLEATSTFVQGSLISTPNTPFTIQLFSSDECDPSGHGEGKVLISSIELSTDHKGTLLFADTLSPPVPTGKLITATATDPDGNTSEFSNCVPAGEPCVITINSPNGEETWNAGEAYEISWMSEGEGRSGMVIIEYSLNGGNNWAIISGGTDDDGSYEWTVPGTPSDNCLMIVCGAGDSTCCGISDDVFTIHADCDFAITHLTIPNPVSMGYVVPIRVAVTNFSTIDMALGDAYIDILNEGGECIFFGDPVMMERLYTDLYFLVSAGDTLIYAYQYDWVPSEAGNFSIKVTLDFPCDTFSVNDIMDAGPVTVSEGGTGLLGFFDQYSPERDIIYLEVEGGPAVRYTIPDDLPGASIHTLYFGAVLDNPEASLWMYLFGPGPDDTTFGQELIEPFEYFPQETDSTGLTMIDLTVRPDYENLIGLSGDFWVHLRASPPTAFGFIARPALPDMGLPRNWYYVWSVPRSGGDPRGKVSQPPGYMDPFSRGWEELVGLDYSTCLIERGDVTRDGKVNVLDVLAVINHILGIIVIEDLETLCRADCNNDTAVNVLDALGIANVILGIGECQP